MPLLLKGNFNGFQIFAASQVSYLARAALQVNAGVLGYTLLKSKIDMTNQMNRWDLGAVAGVSFLPLAGES